MSFHDIRLPTHIERGASGGPTFLTTVIARASGMESRNQEWQYAKAKWDISYGIMNITDYTEVRLFFYARKGRANTFRFRDWTDYEATAALIGTGTGALTTFQLVKNYIDTASSYSRKITRIVAGTLSVYLNGVLVDPNDYTVSATGLITFDTAPLAAVSITATFEFDIPVRFDNDQLRMAVEWVGAASMPDITIVEVPE